MKLTALISCLILMLASCGNKEKSPEITVKEITLTEEGIDPTDFFTPGPQHKWLESFKGEWEADVISYMDPTRPDTSKLTQTYSTILNGLYQEAKTTGSMMGMPFEGRSINGYDNAKRKFQTTWIDNFSSGFTYMSGDFDSTTNTLHLKGTQSNPSTGENMGIREEMKIIDKDTYTLIMYGDGAGGKEIKFMEGTFKRRK